ncbi:ABC transporter ATP-binding protein/permease [Blautia sp. MSK17_66]|uniref:ABC transporter ATP-binding protein n=1 Tax=Blautia TaxID=572511 RepID=UPI00156FE332|nr:MULTISPECIES: ABC transporter ATP-binding protein [Blautia]MCB5548906.1 ABC transporter ATP-binding protein/permease [Blautia sp. MSK17_66]NSK00398.1 ABC transporter ATP-binding protein [Blautia obeum]
MSTNNKKTSTAGSAETLFKVLHFIGRYRLLLISSIILASVSVVLQLYVPVLFGDAIDQIIAKHTVNFEMMWYYLSRILVMVIVSSLAVWVMNIINNRMTFRTVQDIRSRAIRHIQVLPLSYLDGHSTGDIISRVIADTDILSDGLLLGFTQLFSGIVTIIGTLIFMFSKNFWITLLVIVLTPLSFFVARFISSRSFHMFRKQSDARGRQTALIEEMIGNQKIVQAFGYEDKSSARFAEINQELKECSQKAIFYSSLTNPSTRFVNNVIYAGVALAGAFMIPGGALTVGGLSVLLSYANQYMKPFNDISSVITELQNALACAARIFALLEETPESPDPEETISNVQGEVNIDNISFRYVPDKKLIENFHLHAEPGKRIAIVGPTGCGKTTFINLLMRFYDVTKGSISIDRHPIDQISRHSLRSSFGMVLQETWIKNGTVRDNINIGRPDASDEEIIEAAKRSHSWEFIRRLPDKLDTILKEDSLSQGEKQLLCITRVMLCLPPMLILDEATSSIDTRTELMVQEAFEHLMKGRTSFIVAHRLSTIRNADEILVMKDGAIIEQGSHEELMAKGGFYQNLYNSQFVRVSE